MIQLQPRPGTWCLEGQCLQEQQWQQMAAAASWQCDLHSSTAMMLWQWHTCHCLVVQQATGRSIRLAAVSCPLLLQSNICWTCLAHRLALLWAAGTVYAAWCCFSNMLELCCSICWSCAAQKGAALCSSGALPASLLQLAHTYLSVLLLVLSVSCSFALCAAAASSFMRRRMAASQLSAA